MNINRKKVFVYVLVILSILYILGISYATEVSRGLSTINEEVDTDLVEKDDHLIVEGSEKKDEESVVKSEQEDSKANPSTETKTVKENENTKKSTEDEKANKSTKSETKKASTSVKQATQSNGSVKTVSELETIKNKNDKLGSMGRLYIPSINLNVGVYYANVLGNENYNAQAIVDRKDSAAYYRLGSQYIIADHNYQGFNKLISVSSGAKAYIKKSDGTVVIYKLKRKFEGRNTGADLTDAKGTSIQDMEAGLVMYTCYKSEKIIMVTLWELC